MPTDVDIPLIDHHCHGLVPRNLTRPEFEKMISESFVDAPVGTSHFDTPFGLAIRAHCAPLLDLEPFADPDAYMERRAALGAPAVNKRFVKAGNHGLLLIDTGFRADDILTPEGVSSLTGVPSREVVRIEAVAERVQHTRSLSTTTTTSVARAGSPTSRIRSIFSSNSRRTIRELTIPTIRTRRSMS